MSLSYLRAILITDPLIVLATILMGSISMAASLFDSTGRAQHKVARIWARMLLAISGVRVRVEGLEQIDPRAPYVIASNHLSYMDTPVVLAWIPLQFRFLAKRGLFRIPFLGTHLHRAGHIPVPREDARAAVKTLNDAGRIVRERGVSILVFPEGGRSPAAMRPFKEGAAYIAIRAGAPIVPVALVGTRPVLPMGSVHVRSGHVTVRIARPIPTAGLKIHDRSALTEQVRDEVARLLNGANPVH
ncbi:MAG: 1-acyl-sn-glycerol-3-phosphate acyltransferase [Bryobacterales bacterium]|nr:1-acyl-sn-glycerol-3-phosphate acyltransferase [Bryobacterales bacterium]